MGWANCGEDSKGRPIGYAHEGTCDEPGCTVAIDRGLSYACGGMHGEDEISCEGYFCSEHLYLDVTEDESGEVLPQLCMACIDLLEEYENEESN